MNRPSNAYIETLRQESEESVQGDPYMYARVRVVWGSHAELDADPEPKIHLSPEALREIGRELHEAVLVRAEWLMNKGTWTLTEEDILGYPIDKLFSRPSSLGYLACRQFGIVKPWGGLMSVIQDKSCYQKRPEFPRIDFSVFFDEKRRELEEYKAHVQEYIAEKEHRKFLSESKKLTEKPSEPAFQHSPQD